MRLMLLILSGEEFVGRGWGCSRRCRIVAPVSWKRVEATELALTRAFASCDIVSDLHGGG